jgi:hypothetical protein
MSEKMSERLDELPWFIDPRDHEAVEEHLQWLDDILAEVRAPFEQGNYIDMLDEEANRER